MHLLSSEATKGRWYNAKQLAGLDPTLADWLFDGQSLTRKLTRCFGTIDLRVLHEQPRSATLNECQILQLPQRTLVIERQVQLCDQQGVLVNALSLLPLPSLRGGNRQLRLHRLKPLGQLLFRLGCTRPQPLACQQQGHWQRLSVFRVQQQPIMVIERFHPRVLAHAA